MIVPSALGKISDIFAQWVSAINILSHSPAHLQEA
jgi:hypothetical protein